MGMTRALGVAGLVAGGFLMTLPIAGSAAAATPTSTLSCPVNTSLNTGTPTGTTGSDPIIQTTVATAAPVAASSITSSGQQLAFTGIDVGAMLALGGGLIGGGALLVQMSRRRVEIA